MSDLLRGVSDGDLLAEAERRGLLAQVTATIAEDLARTRRERDRLLPFVIQKCLYCGAVTAPVVDEEPPRSENPQPASGPSESTPPARTPEGCPACGRPEDEHNAAQADRCLVAILEAATSARSERDG
jgi:hypothetical protein